MPIRLPLLHGNSPAENSWICYDWANSAYSIVVTTAIFPLFYKSLAGDAVYLTSWAFGNSVAGAMVALMAPVLGCLADFRGMKKRLFVLFLVTGVAATCSFSLLARGQCLLAMTLYGASVVGFAGANLFYDAFLVDITSEARMDRISTAGFGYGYIGSTIPFVLGLILITQSARFGLPSSEAGVRISFGITGLWWMAFSIPMLKNVSQRYGSEPTPTPFRDSFHRLAVTLRQIRRYRDLFTFLLAYFFYIEGVNTIIRMATPIAVSVGIEQGMLLIVLLAVQVVAFPCALVYGILARRWSGRRMIHIGILIYSGVVLLAFWLPSVADRSHRMALFWVLSMMVASSQGGIQALSRSFFARRVPKEKASEFFGFYNIMGKFSAVLGPFAVGSMTLITGEERYGILSVLGLFVIGGVLFRKAGGESAS